MADLDITTNSSSYVKDVEAMIAANKKLIASFKDLSKMQSQMNSLMSTMNKGAKSANRVGNNSANGVSQFIRNRGGRVAGSASGASKVDRLKDLSSQANNIIKNTVGKVANSSITSSGGAKSFANSIGKVVSNTGNKAKKALNGVFGGGINKVIGKTAAGIGLVVTALGSMYKVGQQGYQQNIKLKNSLTQLGSGAEYAYKYASKLNEELGTPLNSSIGNIAGLASQLKGTGGWSSGATGVATGAYDLSTKVGLFYQNDPQEVFQNMQKAILTGENSLLQYNVQVSDEVLAGWLAATKGINMYSTELSDGAKQAYRWMMIQEQLADITAYQGDLTNTAFAKQLQMTNRLEEIGIKLKALFMPLFSWLVEQANTFVDVLLQSVNSIRSALGMEKIEWQTTSIAERDKDIVDSLDAQNAAYRKQGELIKKNANQRLPFDEWISLDSLQQMNDSLESIASNTDFDSLGSFTGTNETLNISDNNIKDIVGDNSVKEISALIKTTDRDGLLDMWDNFNLLQKGMYGTDVAVRLFQEGEIGKGLEALLFGAVGSFTGIEAIKELANGDYVGAIDAGAKTALFWFGGWKGKIAAASGVLVETGVQLFGVSEDVAEISSIVAMIGILIGGWKGALVAALGILVPIAAKLGEIAGKWTNMQLNKSLGAEGTWGSIQSFDSRSAANMKYGKGTPEAEAYYYELMYEKFGEDANIPKYASGGIALSPHLAEIGHGTEAVIPLNSYEGDQFAETMASKISSYKTRDAYNDAERSTTNLIVPVSTFIGDTAAYNELIRRIHDSLLDIERNEGGAFNGTHQ